MKNIKNGSPEKRTNNKVLRHLNKSAIARDMNLSPQYVGQILSGKRKGRKHQTTLYKITSAIYKIAN